MKDTILGRRLASLLCGLALLAGGGPASAEHHEAMAASAEGAVARGLFTSEIQEREPVDEVTHVASDVGRITFFSELHGLSGQTITHRWRWAGEIQAEVPFEVGGDRWRVWSSKTIVPSALGEWRVSVVDENGAVLAERSLTVAEAAASGDEPAPGEPAAEASAEAGAPVPGAPAAEESAPVPGAPAAEELAPVPGAPSGDESGAAELP